MALPATPNTASNPSEPSGAELEREILAATPDARLRRIEGCSLSTVESLVEMLAARARAASTVSPTESLRISEITWELAAPLSSPRAHAHARWAQGAALRALSRFEEAVNAFQEGSQYAIEAGDPHLAARIPMGATETLAQLGRHEEALQLSADLEARFNALGAAEDAAKVIANAGNIYFQREDFSQALEYWERALAFFEERGEQIRVARLQMNVGNALCCLYRLPEARQMYESAREILEAAGMDLLVAGLDGDLGFIGYMSGRHNESLQAYVRARNRFEALDLPRDVAQCDRETADVYLDLNLIPEAREMYERVLPVFRERQMPAEAARSELGLATTLFRQGQSDEAFTALDRAEAGFQSEGNSIGVARVRLRRASFLHRQGEYGSEDTVGEATRTALRTFRQQGLTQEILQTRLLLAEMRVAEGEDPASQLRKLSAEAEDFPALQWQIEAARARGARNSDRGRAALKHYRAAVAMVERARHILQGNEFRIAFLQDKMRLYEELMDLLLTQGTSGYLRNAFRIFERAKSRTLVEAMSAPSETTTVEDTERQALRQRLDSLRAQFNWQYIRAEHPDAGAGRLPSPERSAQEISRSLEKEYLQTYRQLEVLGNASPLSPSAPSPQVNTRGRQASEWGATTQVHDIQRLLPEDEQIIAYATVQDEVLAFVIERKGFEIVRGLASRTEVEGLVERLRFQWHKMETTPYLREPGIRLQDATDQILGQLYNLLLEPFDYLLTKKRLTIVPHGILHNVPFQALADGEGYLIDRFEIAYTPSCSVWQAGKLRKESQGERSLVFGLSDGGLTHTQEELKSLQQILPDAEVFSEQAATLSAVPVTGAFRYLHFATHAVFRKDNPLFSALRMADGWLFAHDLYRRRLDCSLATLSACHTGTGAVAPGDEVLGLVHGFLHAGIRAVLVSRWAADDAATALLMRECYAGMVAGGNRAAALRAAQQAVRQQWSHPYYWATFALIGNR